MRAEFTAWERTLVWHNAAGEVVPPTPSIALDGPTRFYPPMNAEGGLPVGWEACWLSEHSTSTQMGVPYTVCVVHRTAGGWGLVFAREGETLIWVVGFRTAGNLYETARTAGPDNVALAGMVGPVSAFIVSCYDLTDEAEAAEATLVGLGGLVTILPRSLAPLP